MKRIILKKNEEKRLIGGHLWIYSNEVDTAKTPLNDFLPGDVALVISNSKKILGSAYINPHSLICGRLFSRQKEELGSDLIRSRIKKCLKVREYFFDHPFYRLVFGESDELPGLVIDRFGEHLVVQLNSAGMERVKEEIVEALQKEIEVKSILFRNDSSIRKAENLNQEIIAAFGKPPEDVELLENGVKMIAPLARGQKTGWFYDQRPNRAWLKSCAPKKRVLDVFSYIGSFGIQAGAFGAKDIWCVDSSRFALETAEKNAALNGIGGRFTGCHGDAFDVLRALHGEGEKFDVIVVDPPAFIKRKKDHREGFRAYVRINEMAMRLLKPEGLLLSASCSMHLKRDELVDVLRQGASKTGKHLRIIREGTQSLDHPVHPAIPETRYIKAFLAYVI